MDIKLKIKNHQKSTNNFHDNQLNIILSGKDINNVMQKWMQSPGHKKNILSDFKEIGIGYASNNKTTYFVILFGSRSL
jgi:uncharacterized protein YkwD